MNPLMMQIGPVVSPSGERTHSTSTFGNIGSGPPKSTTPGTHHPSMTTTIGLKIMNQVMAKTLLGDGTRVKKPRKHHQPGLVASRQAAVLGAGLEVN